MLTWKHSGFHVYAGPTITQKEGSTIGALYCRWTAELVINADNGPECNGHRSQFLLRMTEFADSTGLRVRIIYYPPYHSKYNGIERYWAGLEKSWNGYLLDTVNTVLNRAGNFLWKGLRTVATLLDAAYEKGIKVCGKEKSELEKRIQRSTELPWWDLMIHPVTV